jgi:hypothetical protein
MRLNPFIMTDVLDRLLYRRPAVRISLHAILVPEVNMIQGRLPLDSKRLRALVVGEGGLLRWSSSCDLR